MSFQAWQGVAGGAAGVVAMSMLMRMALGMGMTRMEMPVILGSMLRRRREQARPLGMMAHGVNGLLFGLAYAAVWYGIGIGHQGLAGGVWIGAAFGAVHGIVVAMAMPMMSAMHPRVSEGARMAEAPSGEVVLPPFGFGGKGFGKATPMGLWIAHILFGAVWGVVFAAVI